MTFDEKTSFLNESEQDSPSGRTILALDHVTLRTRDLEATRKFLEDLLDVKSGFRPDFSFPGHWLYAGKEPLIHLIPARSGPSGPGGDAIDHVGFRLVDHGAYLRKLDDMGITYSRMALPELNERRLFVHTPGAILLELVFRDDPGIAAVAP